MRRSPDRRQHIKDGEEGDTNAKSPPVFNLRFDALKGHYHA